MHSERKNQCDSTIKDRRFSSRSVISDSGISLSVKNENCKGTEDKPLLERILQYKKPDSEIFKFEHHDTDSVSLLEFPFSDEEIQNEEPRRQSNEIAKNLDVEDNQFSSEFLQTLEEINKEKGLLSLPCSTCSECSSCSTDTWEQLQITEDCLTVNPTPLEEETIKALDELNNEHFAKLNNLLSKTNQQDYDDSSEESESQELKVEETQAMEKKEKRKKLHKYTIKLKKTSCNERDLENYREWKTLSSLDHIFITSPDYDYEHDAKTRGIHIENDTIPWAVKERSRVKCTDWLNSYLD